MAFILFDTETTGSGEEDRICQIALGIIGNPTEYISEYCKPPLQISYHAMAVHGITNEKIENAPDFKSLKSFSVLSELNSKENTLIAHNAKFDIEMILKEGIAWNGNVIDTLRCSKHLLPDEESHALQYLRYSLSIYKEEGCEEERMLRAKYSTFSAHDALFDIYILKKLFSKLLKSVKSTQKMIELTNMPVQLKKMKFGKYKGCLFDEIARKDRSYLQWLSQNSEDEDIVYTCKMYP